MKHANKREVNNIQSAFEDTAYLMTQQHDKKYNRRDWLAASQEKTAAEKAKWRAKLDKLESELATAKDRVYAEKSKCRTLIQKQINKTECVPITQTHSRIKKGVASQVEGSNHRETNCGMIQL